MAELSRRYFLKNAAFALGAAGLGAAGTAGLAGATGVAGAQVAAEAAGPATAGANCPGIPTKAPKYIFFFIGDGMSYPQVQLASYGRAAAENVDAPAVKPLGFMDFPVVGAQYTYNTDAYCPDSASTATALASGKKTASGYLNLSPEGNESFKTIAEVLRDVGSHKIGVVTNVNLNHATPAGFYAHQPGRHLTYEIGKELAASNFDFFAGGNFLNPTGEAGNLPSLISCAEEAGYRVVSSVEEASECANDRIILIPDNLAEGDVFPYTIDATASHVTLAKCVNAAVSHLTKDDQGFFLMVEGGMIDWAAHANDGATLLQEMNSFNDAVDVAIRFAEAYPEETLIIVTGDHETGGLSLGYSETNYGAHYEGLLRQQLSFARFDIDYVEHFKQQGLSFESAAGQACPLFGLLPPGAKAESSLDEAMTLTAEEWEELRDSYRKTVTVGRRSQNAMSGDDYEHFGTYQPFTATLTRIMNHKCGIDFSTFVHSGLTVPVFAWGVGANRFAGFYENTDIPKKLLELAGL